MVEILPSILAADFARLADEIAKVEPAGIRMLHVDVMDGHFVPNITLGPPVVKAIRKVTKLTLDCHFMITNPDDFIGPFVEAGADQISVHQEACPHLDRTLRTIQSEGARAGVVLNPATPISWLDHVLDKLDMVLIMSVNPGFGGQTFIGEALNKIRLVRERVERSGRDIWIQVDGGVKIDNIGQIARAGADAFVAGSAIFKSTDYAATIAAMRAEVAKS